MLQLFKIYIRSTFYLTVKERFQIQLDKVKSNASKKDIKLSIGIHRQVVVQTKVAILFLK